MNDGKNNGRGIFYGVIGVATLVVAIIGATFAYFTATASNNDVITGNMATITFNLAVEKKSVVDQTKGGMIPMSNTMVEAAVNQTGEDKICLDNNGNAVCQIYKITVTNGGTATMFLDGYVTLTDGSGTPADYTYTDNDATTMRWAQAFCTESSGKLSNCTTVGVTTTGATGTGSGFGSTNWDAISKATSAEGDTDKGLNKGQIKSSKGDVVANGTFGTNTYEIINTNYIRVSDRSASATTYDRTNDITSALVFNQQIDPKDTNDDNNTGDSDTTFTDAQVYYIVVWLSENGFNQTAGADNAAEDGDEFFQGVVTFNSAQGSEVTATFSGYTAVVSDKATAQS